MILTKKQIASLSLTTALMLGVSQLPTQALPSIPGVGGTTSGSLTPVPLECESDTGAFIDTGSLGGSGGSSGGGSGGSSGGTVFTDWVSGLIGDFNFSNVINVQEILRNIMSGIDLPSEFDISTAVESNQENSFAQRKDYGESTQRNAVLATVEDATLSDEAQQKTVDDCNFVVDTTQAIYDLGEDSQGLDTTQQIMQNISAQLGQQASVDSLMSEDTTQIRQSLALSATLQSQIATKLHEQNVTERRNVTSSKNLESAGAGGINVPGGLW